MHGLHEGGGKRRPQTHLLVESITHFHDPQGESLHTLILMTGDRRLEDLPLVVHIDQDADSFPQALNVRNQPLLPAAVPPFFRRWHFIGSCRIGKK
ncbi:MAG: hypothetical protein ACK4K7_12705 [Allosphingosinicella sp.]|uniref:hypothetical protein n=1 Tax=Allosphingosinicella sp. TaxID=2823234 RepID=UPI00393DE067